jgi:hypothetical protein
MLPGGASISLVTGCLNAFILHCRLISNGLIFWHTASLVLCEYCIRVYNMFNYKGTALIDSRMLSEGSG